MMRGTFYSEQKFTLIEMLIVISIIVILAAMLGGVLITQQIRAKNEAQGNQIKLLLGALEQFKTDFGEYPTVDGPSGTGVDADNWTEGNSLAFRLCQEAGNTTLLSMNSARVKEDVNARLTWNGSYLTSKDFGQEMVIKHGSPSSTTNKAEILDLWGNPLAYCAAPNAFYKDTSKTAATEATLRAEADKSSLQTSITGGVPSNNYVAQKVGNQYFARPMGATSKGGFLGPNSWVMKGAWNPSELGMPEIWSRGADGVGFLSGKSERIQYNGSSTNANFKNSTSNSGDVDNVGGLYGVIKTR